MENGHARLSKIGEIRMFMHRPLSGNIEALTIKRETIGDWFMIFTVQADVRIDEPGPHMAMQNTLPEQLRPIDTDLGLKSITTTSEGL